MSMPTTTPAEERARAERAIEALKLSAKTSKAAKGQLRAAIGVYTKRVDDLPVGVSRYGGCPDLPTGVTWPTDGKAPLMFVAQFALAEVGPFDVDGRLPRDGLLSFFVDEQVTTVRVLHVDAKGLVRAKAPKKYLPISIAALRFHTTFQLPSPHTGVQIFVDPWAIRERRATNAGQLLGYDAHHGYDAPLPAQTSPLFRCESVDTWLNFGDAQPISFRLTDEELAARRFETATLWWQAG